MPAVNIWIGDSDAFNHAPYWTDGIPTSDDILVFTGPTSPPPPPPGMPPPPPVPPPPYSNADVSFPTTADLSFAGIRYENGYSGATYFPANISFGSYTQDTGTTEQAADKTLTVTSAFCWTGGDINATTNTATYKLAGVLGAQFGIDTSTLSSGSKIVLDKNVGNIGTSATQHGVLNVVGTFEVLENCLLEVRQLIDQPGNKPKNLPTAGLVVKGETTTQGAEFTSVKVIGAGVLDVRADIKVTDKVPGTDWGLIVDGTIDPVLVMKNFLVLEATHGVYIKNGQFITTYNQGVTQTPEIDGAFRIDAGKIELGVSDPVNVVGYTTLTVTGRTYLWGTGKFHTRIDTANAGNRDAIHTKEKFNIGANFTIQPDTVANAAFSPVLVSDEGFTDNVDPNNPDPTKWEMQRDGTGKNFEVKKK